MKVRSWVVLAGIGVGMFGAAWASGQERMVAALPFSPGMQTAGPGCTDFEPPRDSLDYWVIEDFVLPQAVNLTRFESEGTIWEPGTFVFDVNVRVYRGWPPEGDIVASSTPGAGTVTPIVPFQSQYFRTKFPRSYLPAGSYYLVWNAATRTSLGQEAIWWHNPGPHLVGGGVQANAWVWNPNGGMGWPNNLLKVPADLSGGGQTGVNFILWGEPAPPPVCRANCTGDTDPVTGRPKLDVLDFACFQNAYALADLSRADAGGPASPCGTPDGKLDIFDFVCFQNLFALGCP